MLSGPATEDGPWRARHPVPATVCNLYHDLDTDHDDQRRRSSGIILQHSAWTTWTRFATVLFIAAFGNFQPVVTCYFLNVVLEERSTSEKRQREGSEKCEKLHREKITLFIKSIVSYFQTVTIYSCKLDTRGTFLSFAQLWNRSGSNERISFNRNFETQMEGDFFYVVPVCLIQI